MGSYEKTMADLTEMKSRFQSGFSSSDRLLLDKLHRFIYGSEITNTGCSDCYRDAYVMIYNKLKTDKEMPKAPNYILKGGAIIHPVGTSRFYTNPLPSDDIAEEFLSKFPQEVNKFAQLPVDWEDRVAAYKARKAEEARAKAEAEKKAEGEIATTVNDGEAEELKTSLIEAGQQIESLRKDKEDLSNTVKTLTEEKAELTQKVEALNKLLAERAESESAGENSESEEVNNLQMELATAKAELDAAQAENEQLKLDNRALKAANTRLKKQ